MSKHDPKTMLYIVPGKTPRAFIRLLHFDGDRVAAQRYAQANLERLMREFRRLTGFQGLQQNRMVICASDGSMAELTTQFGQEVVKVFVPPQAGGEKVRRVRPERKICPMLFAYDGDVHVGYLVFESGTWEGLPKFYPRAGEIPTDEDIEEKIISHGVWNIPDTGRRTEYVQAATPASSEAHTVGWLGDIESSSKYCYDSEGDPSNPWVATASSWRAFSGSGTSLDAYAAELDGEPVLNWPPRLSTYREWSGLSATTWGYTSLARTMSEEGAQTIAEGLLEDAAEAYTTYDYLGAIDEQFWTMGALDMFFSPSAPDLVRAVNKVDTHEVDVIDFYTELRANTAALYGSYTVAKKSKEVTTYTGSAVPHPSCDGYANTIEFNEDSSTIDTNTFRLSIYVDGGEYLLETYELVSPLYSHASNTEYAELKSVKYWNLPQGVWTLACRRKPRKTEEQFELHYFGPRFDEGVQTVKPEYASDDMVFRNLTAGDNVFLCRVLRDVEY